MFFRGFMLVNDSPLPVKFYDYTKNGLVLMDSLYEIAKTLNLIHDKNRYLDIGNIKQRMEELHTFLSAA
ncbi:MAG TPA: hypothetical protein DHD79_09335 [Firmicutes bacterium]|jgi:hypothetical protein|nr:hypothetical protein [Bacillota bacterium]